MIKDMSFSSIPGRAVAFSLLFVAIIVASCVNDDYAGQQSGSSSGREVTVTVNIPRQQSPSTRSIDDQGGKLLWTTSPCSYLNPLLAVKNFPKW